MDGISVSVSIFGDGFFLPSPAGEGGPLAVDEELACLTSTPSIVDKGVKMIPYNKKLVSNAQYLRKNMTPEEKHLWYDFLKKLPLSVKRQHNIDNYIVDFYIASKKIVIEIDGIQHNTREHKESDKKRDEVLADWDIIVLRYSNKSINTNFVAVTKDILTHLGLDFSDLKKS